jgi:predicted acetyltransferase
VDLLLRALRVDDEVEAWAAHRELQPDDFDFLLNVEAGEPWADYVARLDRYSHGDVPEHLVPASFLVADLDGEIVGRASIRYRLNDWLLQRGGHIGYGVRPASRRRGYATEILRQSLAFLTELGLDRALLTCDDGNAASAMVIEQAGGVLENVVTLPDGTGGMRRYWIDLAPSLRA